MTQFFLQFVVLSVCAITLAAILIPDVRELPPARRASLAIIIMAVAVLASWATARPSRVKSLFAALVAPFGGQPPVNPNPSPSPSVTPNPSPGPSVTTNPSPCPPLTKKPPPGARRAGAGDFQITVMGCRRTDGDVTCFGSVTSRVGEAKLFRFNTSEGAQTYIADNGGHWFEDTKVDFGNEASSASDRPPASQELPPCSSANFSVSFKGIPPEATKATLVLRCLLAGEHVWGYVLFRDIALE